MKKIFLVDDEIVIRENIRNCINWEEEGFDYCGDAPDGEIALPLLEQMQPDILITDIKMPFMNGLELSALVRNRLPKTKIIILSGYDEFEYARQALRLGIEDYCLKPFGSADMIRMLHSVSAKIDQEAARRKQIELLEKNLSAQVVNSRERLLSDLCNGFISSVDAIEKAAANGLRLISRYYAVAVTDVDTPSTEAPNRLTARIQQVEEELGKRIARLSGFLTYRKSRTETVWIFTGDAAADLEHTLEKLSSDIRKETEQSCRCTISIGIGSTQDRLQGIHLSYIEAERDKHWRRLSHENKQALLSVVESATDRTILLDRNRFVEFLKVGTPPQIAAFIQDFAAGLEAVQWDTSQYGHYLLNDLTLEAFRDTRMRYPNVADYEETLSRMQQSIISVHTFHEACAYLRKLIEQCWVWRMSSASKYSELIDQVKRYVQLNYSNERISLQDAAEHVRVSPSHLSKVFSQATGQTFVEYLMHTRVRKAMELLQCTSNKSYEIAEQVGYQDPHYFSNVFKRVTGMSTREFRKQGQAAHYPHLGGTSHET